MARTDANPPMPEFATDYVLQEVDPKWLTSAVKPKQFLHIDQAECILCEGCVDICPWKCIHMLAVDAIEESVGTEKPGDDPGDHVFFVVDEDVCTRCALCVDRCPTGVIILAVTGIFLMFFYRPTSVNAWHDIKTLETAVTFGSLVRNMHRWGAHLMVLSVFLHMSRVFYHGAYKPPREFNWVVGVMLLQFTLLLSFTGYLLPWDQLALWAVTVGTNMMGYTPVFGNQVRFVLLGTKEIGTETLLRWYTLHVLMLPFVVVIFMAIHFWRVRKDGGISGPL